MRPRVVCLVCAMVFGTHAARADTLGDAVAVQGGSAMEVTAGNAIQGTCRALATAGGPNLAGRQLDLFYRCNEMVTTYGLGLPSNPFANSYGFVPGTAGNSNRSEAVRQFSGEETSGQRRLGAQGNDLQVGAIGARMDAIRQGIRPSGSGLAMNVNGVDIG